MLIASHDLCTMAVAVVAAAYKQIYDLALFIVGARPKSIYA